MHLSGGFSSCLSGLPCAGHEAELEMFAGLLRVVFPVWSLPELESQSLLSGIVRDEGISPVDELLSTNCKSSENVSQGNFWPAAVSGVGALKPADK